MLTKGAIGNLINRYKAVLTKCNLINVFGSLAVATMLVAGSAAVAEASQYSNKEYGPALEIPDGATETITENINFANNSDGSFRGGSAINNSGILILSGENTFESNAAAETGGAIYNQGNITMSSENSFSNNSAGLYGGAIYNGTNVDNGKETTILNIKDATFTNNKAEFVLNHEGTVYVLPGEGGAIYNMGIMNITGAVNFSGNTALHGDDIYNPNGTIFVGEDASISLDGGYAGGGVLVFKTSSTFIVEDASKIIDGSAVSLLLNGKSYGENDIVYKHGSLVVQSGAKLKLNNVAANKTYRIADDFGGIYSNYTTHESGRAQADTSTKVEDGALTAGWNGEDGLISDTHLLVNPQTKVVQNEDGSYGVIVEVKEATANSSGDEGSEEGGSSTSGVASILPDIKAPNALNAMVKSGIDVDAEEMGLRFLSRATDTDYLPGGTTPVPQTYARLSRAVLAPTAPANEAELREISAKLINEVASASVTAGVQNTALRLSDAASENVLNHLSLGNFDSGNSIHADGTDFWATPMYGNTYTSGMSSSGVSVRGNYGGIAFGADTQVGEVLGGKVRVGAALNGGGGKSETKGTVTTTQNDYNFGGINLYAGWNKGNLNVIAGLGYGIGDNEVEMGLPASMKMGTAKADVDTSVITADLRAEYQLKTNWLDILPHAGVRYTALRTDSHDLKVNGSVLNSVEADTQHIVQFPIGVTLTKNIDAWGWNVKPQFDVSLIPAAGDKDMNTKVRFSGVDAVDSIDTRIMDSTSWSGMVGIQASKGNLSFGLNYGIQASSHETDQRVQASIGWKF